MTRAFLVVLDSLGIGGAPDASDFGDLGANTLGHIAQACALGHADKGGRKGALRVPHLDALGLGAAARLASGGETPGLCAPAQGLWGAARETSSGKDTPSGHWELAGVPVPWDWHYFPKQVPAFPEHVVSALCQAAGVDGILGNCHASGTEIVDRLGPAHIGNGWPICYTSTDSVFQIAAHEEVFGLERLIDLCRTIAPVLHGMKVGRVIARPFRGNPDAGFVRTAGRRDFAMAPPGPTILDRAHGAGRDTHAIGKIGDIFSHRGIVTLDKGNDAALMGHLVSRLETAAVGSLTFANFVEFDSLYGHRRDVAGYARAMEWFDTFVPDLLARLRPGDLLLFTADHGNDPTWQGTDHTRESVPVLGAGVGPVAAGLVGFSDVGATVAAHLGLPPLENGRSFL